MIRVVAAGALDPNEVEGAILARTTRVFVGSTLQVANANIVHSYDAIFEGDLEGALDEIAADVRRRGTNSDITYVVPALPGDATVARLDPGILASVTHGSADRGGFANGQCLVVDALEIADAELHAPFERGLIALEPLTPTVVTNWYGSAVTALAGRRLRRLYGTEHLPGRVQNNELLIPAIERLHPAASVSELEHIVARLRRPDGCPWDRAQSRESLYPQFVDELEELGEAIRAGDIPNQMEELGDVLFHVVAQCQLAAEAGDFTLDGVLREVTGKLVRRHPHVFGDVKLETVDDVLATWNRVKAEEKFEATRRANDTSRGEHEGETGV